MTILPSVSDVLDKVLRPVSVRDVEDLQADHDTLCLVCRDEPLRPVSLPCSCRYIYCRDCIALAFTRSDSCPTCGRAMLWPLIALVPASPLADAPPRVPGPPRSALQSAIRHLPAGQQLLIERGFGHGEIVLMWVLVYMLSLFSYDYDWPAYVMAAIALQLAFRAGLVACNIGNRLSLLVPRAGQDGREAVCCLQALVFFVIPHLVVLFGMAVLCHFGVAATMRIWDGTPIHEQWDNMKLFNAGSYMGTTAEAFGWLCWSLHIQEFGRWILKRSGHF